MVTLVGKCWQGLQLLWGFWDAASGLFLELGVIYTVVFTLGKFLRQQDGPMIQVLFRLYM